MSRTVDATWRAAEARRLGRCAGRLSRLPWRRALLAAFVSSLLLVFVAADSAGARTLGPLSARIAAETDKAPKVSKQPASVTVETGQTATFVSAASGVPTPAVQWEVSADGGASWSPIENADAGTLTIAGAKTAETGDQFRAVFTNAAGEATSRAATLTVQQAPAMTEQPSSTTVQEGQNALFEAAASGSPAPTVKWETSANGGKTWTAVAGATSSSLTIVAVKSTISGHEYRATFKNVLGEVTSQAATLTVQDAPAVTKQPSSVTVNEGQSAVFEATASGFPTPTVQWQVSTDGGGTWSPIEADTTNRLTIASASTAEDGFQYRAIFTNAAGSVASQAATLTVRAVPVVTQQPAGVTVQTGESAVFEAAAGGFPLPTVQWEVSTDGATWSPVAGATTQRLTIEDATTAESGHQYRAVFTNPYGEATSNPASLTVVTDQFDAVAWGSNAYRQLGDGYQETFSDQPVPVTGLRFVTAVSAGGRHSLALLANGTVVAWGANGVGQLGDGNTTESSVPVAVQGLSAVTAIAAGGSHSLALMANGTVMAWGDNESGQLGIGSSVEYVATPVAVKGLANVQAIAAGTGYSLALLTNGTVMAWGENESGQLGTGKSNPSSVPVAVRALSGVSAIAAGGEFSLALLTNGTVEAWGNDERGQLGNIGAEEEGESEVPVPVESLTGVSAIAAGADHGLALLKGGTVMGWGDDSAGELGNGAIKPFATTPVAVSGLSGVTTITAGSDDSAALLDSGSLMTWGMNASGTLGDGIAGGVSDVPVKVVGLTSVVSVSAGRSHMLAYGEPIPTVTSVSPNVGPATGSTTVTINGNTLGGATSVKFGAAEATSFTVESATSITATAPPGSGTVDVTVTTPSGSSPTGTFDRFTYQTAPTVTKLSSKSGPAGGGTSVTVTGSQFTAATSVSFGSQSAVSFTVNSPSSITAVAPAGIAGTVDVQVTNSAGLSATSSKDRFKYLPLVESVSPASGSTLGGASVTVTGRGFAPGGTATSFKFGTVKAKSVSCTSSTTCVVTAPAHAAGTVDVIPTVDKVKASANAPADQFSYS
jgi:alpha-tubulin suppressor-like RCC1 family protein